jgi:hypothetical protein
LVGNWICRFAISNTVLKYTTEIYNYGSYDKTGKDPIDEEYVIASIFVDQEHV